MQFTLDKFFVSCNTKNKKTKEKVLCQNFTKPFCLLFFVDPLPRSAKRGFKGCGKNPNSPHVILRRAGGALQSKDLGSFSQLEKEHHIPNASRSDLNIKLNNATWNE